MTAKTALITGASTGIGYALSKCFATDHHNLILVARQEQRLKQVAEEFHRQYGVTAKIIVADLARPETPQKIADQVRQESLQVNYLVNNAGFGLGGKFTETALTAELEMMQVNMVALVHLTKLFLPEMLSRKSGRVLNVASTAAFQPGPLMAVYYATKAYVLSFSEALANELAGTGVTVTTLCPGPTLTDFQRRAGVSETPLFRGPLTMDAATVARAGYRAMLRGDGLVVPGIGNNVLMQALRITPRRLATAIARRIQEKRG